MSMKRIFIRGTLRHKFRASVAAIGVFDGVHRGHQKVIRRAVAEARRLGVPSVVVTFDPHPVAVLHSRKFLPYIMTLEHRLRLIEALGVDACVVVKFDKRFSSQKPERFVHDFLVARLHVRKVIIGRDFHFGCGRKGSIPLLRSLGEAGGFSVEQISIIKNINKNIKSTYIKELISRGDLSCLKRFLDRPYSFLGEVEKGDARGRRLGYRTANFKKENVVILPPGIYCVRARKNKTTHNGLCYIGRRPTFKRAGARVIQELHLLDHRDNLYGQKILVEFLKKLRDDKRFTDEKKLVRQIASDVRKARRFFARSR
jgi:riboflavin kinase/FMN adenylyltransferase